MYLETARTRSPLNILDIAQFTRPYVLVLVQQEHRDPGSVDEFISRRESLITQRPQVQIPLQSRSG